MKGSFQRGFKCTLVDELNAMEVGEPGYVQSTVILSKLDQLHYRSTSNQQNHDHLSPDKHFMDYEDVTLVIEDGMNLQTITNHNQDLTERTTEQMLRQETEQQLKQRKLTIGLHHVRLNPFPSTWEFSKAIQIISLINLWFQGNKYNNIHHFDILKNPMLTIFTWAKGNYQR